MAKSRTGYRHSAALLLALGMGTASAAAPGGSASRWLSVPRAVGHLKAADIGLVINTADPYSEAVGEYYVERRGLRPRQVLRVTLPVRASLSAEEFEQFKRAVDAHFGAKVQALALAWTMPYAVECNSITGALALGFDAQLCSQTCARSNLSRYFNAATSRPYSELGLRPSMLLASRSVAQAKALIDRGVAADHRLGLRGAPPVNACFASTSDAARNVRARMFPPPGLVQRWGVEVKVEQGDAPRDLKRVLLYQTGLARVEGLQAIGWVDGALADHLTSFGGQLDRENGQMTALAWLDAGATASYGTVSEPCNHPQKFPHPQLLLLHYLQGATALEAYWKSVAWPQQGVFVGEPLAAPFARR